MSHCTYKIVSVAVLFSAVIVRPGWILEQEYYIIIYFQLPC